DDVFRPALRSGRRARSETGICRTPVSVASEAIRVAAELAGPLTDRNILILGTGRMGRVVGRVLTNKGAGNISVVSRTRQHAESLARVCRAKALPWHKLSMAVSQAEVVFATTGAPHAVVTKELVESTLDERPRDKPLVFIDIAVPRDVDPEVGSLRLVSLIDIDAIKDGIGGNLAQRENELPRAEHIVGEEVMRFEQWYREAQLRPLLGALRMQIERIRRNQIERLLNGLDDVTPELRDQLDKFSRSLVTKILHEPTVRLKRESDPKQSALYSEAISRLFGLPQELRNEDTS
ncbi:MAG: glutamyl-tRNA reductase, partial [Gemmatimonadales bacterium]